MEKKILIISQNFYPEIGSAANRIKNIYQLLQEHNYNVTVLTTQPSYPNKKIYYDEKFWNDSSLNHDNGKIHRVSITNRKYSRSLFNRLIYYLEMMVKILWFVLWDKRKYDYVFVTTPPIFIGFVGLFAKLRYRSKLLLDVRDLWPDSLKGVGVFNYSIVLKLFSYLERLLYEKADKIIVNSLGFVKHIQTKAGVKESQISFVPNAARSEEVSREKFEINQPFKVIYAGNLGLAQDIEILKKLARSLDEHNIELTIIGYGLKRPELVEFIKNNSLSNVTVLSPQTRKECLAIIARHQVGIVTLNNNEVFETVLPGKIIDYMTCGVPIVASVKGYSKQVIEKENTGLIASMNDAQEMLDHIFYLQNNPDYQKMLSANCIRFINEKFVWERNIEIVTAYLNKKHINV
ncbi:glycosyltransferase family 4 protein [Pseudalkalibacillus caeni]|uniref:Glycosyltransferase family 4 protein n=1 Tax=Exobacillus caeni TaxID=2574798 RepID=A0A5R9F577_9BACL|nr:glycosyltransferase family 4 protein [Pseudalkalibacillus caeni]TLS38677.1 glycosyltransferase family 4 protein [Pseudalkalibacillus caeni]